MQPFQFPKSTFRVSEGEFPNSIVKFPNASFRTKLSEFPASTVEFPNSAVTGLQAEKKSAGSQLRVPTPRFMQRLIENLKYKTLETLIFENQQSRRMFRLKVQEFFQTFGVWRNSRLENNETVFHLISPQGV